VWRGKKSQKFVPRDLNCSSTVSVNRGALDYDKFLGRRRSTTATSGLPAAPGRTKWYHPNTSTSQGLAHLQLLCSRSSKHLQIMAQVARPSEPRRTSSTSRTAVRPVAFTSAALNLGRLPAQIRGYRKGYVGIRPGFRRSACCLLSRSLRFPPHANQPLARSSALFAVGLIF
jgi:hypothetical protein